MTTTRHIHRASTRAAASTLAGGLIAAGSIVVFAPTAFADEFTASDEDSYYAAIVDAMENPGPDTIVLEADITLMTPNLPLYDSDDDLTIDGAGHSNNNGDFNRDLGGFYAHDEGPLGGSFVFTDVTFSGFTGTWPALFVDAYGTVDLTRVTVDNSTGRGGVALWIGGDVTVTDSTFTGNHSPEEPGGALSIDMQHGDGDVVVTGSTFTNNVSNEEGGAIAVGSDAPVWIDDSTFVGNGAADNGGAVAGSDNVIIDNSVFTDNETWDDERDGGGAVYADAIADIASSTFTNNYSGSDGGAVFAWFETTVTGSTFTGNEAAANGGAVYVGEDSFAAYESTFDTNIAGQDGGAVWADYYADSFDSTWTRNEAVGDGGAIYSDGDGDYSYSWNSTYVGNSAGGDGGAYYGHYYYYETYHSTYSGNTADQGSHVYVNDDQMFPYASVFTGAAGAGDACYSAIAPESWRFNFDADGTCTDDWETEDLAPADGSPLLGTLAHNGGPTKTLLPAAGSVLIDAIPLDDCEEWVDEESDLEEDQRGVDRPQGAGCDIGAVETLANLTFTIPTSGGDISVTVSGALAYSDVTNAPAGAGAPAGVSFPYGVSGYSFAVPFEGSSVTVTLTLPRPVNSFYKVDGSTWTEVTGATISGTSITYQITDGGALDQDGTADAFIVDPVAPGVGAAFTG